MASRAELLAIAARRDDGPADDRDRGAQGEHEPQAPVSEHHGDRERDGEEGDEARLRVREVEARAEECDQADRERQADPPEPDRDEEHGDREDEMEPVQARVLEQRRDPEERRVRVRDLEVGSEEEPPRLGLPEPDRGEERRERHERRRKGAGNPALQRRPRDDRDSRDEREVEEPERDRARPRVPRPEERHGGEHGEERDRVREKRGEGRQLGPPQGAVGERDHGTGHDAVERQEEEGLLVAELHRDAERGDDEEGDGRGRRIADEHRGDRGDRDHEHGDQAPPHQVMRQPPQVRGRHERVAEAGVGDPEHDEPGKERDPPANDERQHGAEGAKKCCKVCYLEVRHRSCRRRTLAARPIAGRPEPARQGRLL